MSSLPFRAISTLKQDIGLFLVSLLSSGISPRKYFTEYMKEDTLHLCLLPGRSWLPLHYRRKFNWAGLHALHKILFVFCLLFVAKQLSFSKQLLTSCLMMPPRRLRKVMVLLAGILVRIFWLSENEFASVVLSVNPGWWFYLHDRVVVRIKSVNVSKVHKRVPSRYEHSVNAKHCAVIIVIILARDNGRPNEYAGLRLGNRWALRGRPR